ncbi:hypothetical protein DCC62_02075 [candidate division KSB1 bacterium]|nr:MAG: hypothetical protein DCC62_02075 [candidate division KSB1 bacterium]
MPTNPKVSFVIIGRNEEKHLAACLQSILQVKYPAEQKEIIFVDNDSTDRSVAIAREFPITVIALKQQPATPGRARNAGLRAARGDYVHFVDGDMTVAPEWLHAALPVFADQQVAAVVGRLQEVHPNKSWFNRFFDLGWRAAPLGEIGNPGGGGMFRTAVLRELGGYDDSLFGAEEIDLGYRLRQRNFKTIRIPHIMVWHDMNMKSLGHFWRRGVRDGFYEMEIIARYFTWSLPLPQDYIWKMNAQILALLVLLTVLINHPNIILVQACWALPVFFLVKKARYFYRATGEQKACWLAACFNYLNLFPIAWGELRYLRIKLAAVLKRLFSMPLARARHASTS